MQSLCSEEKSYHGQSDNTLLNSKNRILIIEFNGKNEIKRIINYNYPFVGSGKGGGILCAAAMPGTRSASPPGRRAAFSLLKAAVDAAAMSGTCGVLPAGLGAAWC